MARIQYSSLVNQILGRLAGSVFASTKGICYIKRYNQSASNYRSIKQTEIRNIINDLSGEFYSLTDTQKSLWAAYASMLSKPVTAINCYISHNLKLIYYFDKASKISSPPLFPGTPAHLSGLTSQAYGTSDSTISWTSPALSTLTVIINYRPVFGIERTTSQQWKFGATCSSNLLSKLIETDYDVSTILRFKCRTIDHSGRLSPWSHISSHEALNAGRYGEPAYGYAFYNS